MGEPSPTSKRSPMTSEASTKSLIIAVDAAAERTSLRQGSALATSKEAVVRVSMSRSPNAVPLPYQQYAKCGTASPRFKRRSRMVPQSSSSHLATVSGRMNTKPYGMEPTTRTSSHYFGLGLDQRCMREIQRVISQVVSKSPPFGIYSSSALSGIDPDHSPAHPFVPSHAGHTIPPGHHATPKVTMCRCI